MPRCGDITDTQPQNITWTPPQGGSGPNYPNI
ncbi:4Fe-4S dicluster domain-containing protein [Aeromonas sobria]